MAIESIVSKISSEALGKAVVRTDEISKPAQGSSFKDMLSQMDSSADFAESVGIIDQNASFPQMQAINGEGVSFTPSEDINQSKSSPASEKIVDMLGEVNKTQGQMDSVINQILYSGKTYSMQELLVLQAHVHQFGMVMETTVKLADQGISSVKAVLNTQIQ